MATVRINNDIRYHVRQQFEALYRQRLIDKQSELANLNIGNACYAKSIPLEIRELANKLNKDPDGKWLQTHDNMLVKMTYIGINGVSKTVHFMVPFIPPVLLPARYTSGCGPNRGMELTEDMEPYKHAKAIYLAIDELEADREKLMASIVNGVLKQCSTLKQVLEYWPTAIDFMPDNVRYQHALMPEKRAKKEISIEIDAQTKISLMKARMLQSK
jgi:hypothetical protein